MVRSSLGELVQSAQQHRKHRQQTWLQQRWWQLALALALEQGDIIIGVA
jgi:hypothetical protein